MMSIKTFDPMAVKDCLVKTVNRFPLTVAFTAAFAIFAMAMVWHPDLLARSTKADVLCYLAEGALLSAAMKFWEERTGEKHVWQQVAAHAALVAIAVIWQQLGFLGLGLAMAHCSVIISLVVACVFLPFMGEQTDIPAFEYGIRLFRCGFLAPFAGFIPTLALSVLVFFSFPLFFGIKASSKDFWSIAIFFQIVFPVLLFLSRVVNSKQVTGENIKVGDSWARLANYFLIPVAATYMVILYCYECHIALAWELPNGGVSYLVAVMMGLFFIVEGYLYFSNHADGQDVTAWYLRQLPLLVMPLLVLMSIGIWRRVSDYGLTAARLYLITLNIWFYIACFFMLRTKVRRIHWIPVSFCIVFVLTSVLPVNYHTIARDYIVNDLNKNKATMPVNEWESRVGYLRDYYQLEYTHHE